MSWNYRWVRIGTEIQLCEVSYDDEGRPRGKEPFPADFRGETLEEVQRALWRAFKESKDHPVLNGSEIVRLDLPDGRYEELMENQDSELTPEELAEGWFFCCDWDGLLIHSSWEEATCCSCNKGDCDVEADR